MSLLNIDSKKPELQVHWEATFTDGSSISQFKNGEENLFKEVQNKYNSLLYFSLTHKSKPIKLIVDLKQGIIALNEINQLEDALITNKNNIRLIYFRRNRVTLTSSEIINHEIIYFLGYQYLDSNGRNKKVILQITQAGNIVIGG